MTNIRADATQIAGDPQGASPVIANITIIGAVTRLFTNSTPTVGFVQRGLTPTVTPATPPIACISQTKTPIGRPSIGADSRATLDRCASSP